MTGPIVVSPADDLQRFLVIECASRLAFLLAPDGNKHAAAVDPSGFRSFPIESVRFRDTVCRLLNEQGLPFDEAAFEAVRQRLLDQDWTKPGPHTPTVARALRALRGVTADARKGRIDTAGLCVLASELRAAVAATLAPGADGT